MAPKTDFHRFWGPVWIPKILLKSIIKSRHFQASPRNSFYTIRAPKKLQNYLQNGFQNQPFSQEDQILKILLSPRRGPSFRGLDTLKIIFFSNNFYNLSQTRLSNALLPFFHKIGSLKNLKSIPNHHKNKNSRNIDFWTSFWTSLACKPG